MNEASRYSLNHLYHIERLNRKDGGLFNFHGSYQCHVIEISLLVDPNDLVIRWEILYYQNGSIRIKWILIISAIKIFYPRCKQIPLFISIFITRGFGSTRNEKDKRNWRLYGRGATWADLAIDV